MDYIKKLIKRLRDFVLRIKLRRKKIRDTEISKEGLKKYKFPFKIMNIPLKKYLSD